MRNKGLIKWILVPLCYLALWQLAAAAVGKSLLLPGPFETLTRFIELLTQESTYISAGLTLLRVMAGYVLGVAAGVLLAAGCAAFPWLDAFLSPLRGVVKATPVTSIILLAILWFAGGVVPVFISFLMVLPIVWMNVYAGIKGADIKLIEMGRAFHFSRWRLIKRVYAPSAANGFLSACSTALGFAWKSGVAAEILSLPRQSVGGMVYRAKLTLETTDLFAWTLIVILLSMLIEKLLTDWMRRLRHD